MEVYAAQDTWTVIANQDTYIVQKNANNNRLSSLSDVTLTGLAQYDILSYDGSEWVNSDTSTVVSFLGLGSIPTNFSISGAADNDFLVYNGTNWTNETAATARSSMGLGSIATQAANSVSITGGAISGVTLSSSSVTVTGGTINGTTVGAVTPASGSFSSLTLSGTANFADNILSRPEIKDYAETRSANATASGSVTVDIENGNVHDLTLTGSITTLTISNPPSTGKVGNLTLILRQGGSGSYTVNWPASVKWANATPPTLSTAVSSVDMVFMVTTDGGTTYYSSFLKGFA